LGYNYTTYNIDSKIIQRSANLKSTFDMVAKGRCDLVLNAYSIPYGAKLAGNPVMPDYFSGSLISDLPPQTFHTYISRNSSRGVELVNKINQTLIFFGKTGVTSEIYRRYLPSCGNRC